MTKYINYIVIFLSLVGCSSSKVVYDFDNTMDFTKYQSYQYFDDMGEGLNELDSKRFQASIDKFLDSVQIKRIDSPSFFIHVISESSKIEGTGIGIGLGSGGGNVGFGMSTGISLQSQRLQEKITIDFVDSITNKLFWQGVLTVKRKERMSPESRIELINEIVQRILSNFPPKKEK